MRRLSLLVVLVLLVPLGGCDKLLSIGDVDRLPDAAPDGPATLACATLQPAPYWCGDFEEPTAITYGNGVPIAITTPPTDVRVAIEAPGAASQHAVTVDERNSLTDTYRLAYNGTATVTTLHAEFDLDIELEAAYSTEVAELGVEESGAHCYVQLQIGRMGVMNIRPDCNGVQAPVMQIFAAIPTGFAHYALDFNVTSGKASATFDGTTTPLVLTYANAGGLPHAAIGVFYVNGAGPALAFDNVVVTTTP